MVLRLRGGYEPLIGIKFVDVSNETGLKKVRWAKNGAPAWLSTTHGLCLEGICTNISCQANGQQVIMPIGYKKFDLVSDPSESTTKCPLCSKYVNPQTCGFNNCWWRWIGVKQNTEAEAPTQCSNDWTYADDAYHYFDRNKSGTVIWRKLVLEAVKDKPTERFYNQFFL